MALGTGTENRPMRPAMRTSRRITVMAAGSKATCRYASDVNGHALPFLDQHRVGLVLDEGQGRLDVLSPYSIDGFVGGEPWKSLIWGGAGQDGAIVESPLGLLHECAGMLCLPSASRLGGRGVERLRLQQLDVKPIAAPGSGGAPSPCAGYRMGCGRLVGTVGLGSVQGSQGRPAASGRGGMMLVRAVAGSTTLQESPQCRSEFAGCGAPHWAWCWV